MQRYRTGELRGVALRFLKHAVQVPVQDVSRIAQRVAQFDCMLPPPPDKAGEARRGEGEFRERDILARFPAAVPYRLDQPVEGDPRLLPAHVLHRPIQGCLAIPRAVRRSRTGKHLRGV